MSWLEISLVLLRVQAETLRISCRSDKLGFVIHFSPRLCQCYLAVLSESDLDSSKQRALSAAQWIKGCPGECWVSVACPCSWHTPFQHSL